MASSSSSSSSHSAPASYSRSWSYDVFLSFRGDQDTCKTFVDHLYSALDWQLLKNYKDDETLPHGEPISPSLLKPIEESRIALMVFSKKANTMLILPGYEENKEDEAHSKEHQKRDAKALFFIHQAVDDYQGSSKVITVKLQSLRREFETSSMKNNESVQEFLARVSSVVGQMRSYGDQIMDEIVVAKAHESRIKRSFIKEEEKAFQTKGDVEF
ncbi:UBN2 domain-containing protein [Tanacetum coccineum]